MRIIMIFILCFGVLVIAPKLNYAQNGAPHNQGFEESQNWFQSFVDRVLNYLKEFVENAGVNLAKIFERIKEFLSSFADLIRRILAGGFDGVEKFFSGLYEFVSIAVDRLFAWQKSIMERAFDKMKVECILILTNKDVGVR